jgi:hypothetical protein
MEAKRDIEALLKRFVEGLKLYGIADSKAMLGYMKAYGKSLTIHKDTQDMMVAIIDQMDKSLKTDTKQIQTDADLMDVIRQSTDEELGLIKKEFTSPEVDQLLEPFRDLKNQLKYYKYKYVHVNMAMIFIVSQFEQLFDTTIKEISVGYVADMQSQKQVLGKFVELSRRLAIEAMPNTKEQQSIDALAKRTYTVIDEKQRQTQERVAAIKLGSADEMIRTMLKNAGFREHLENMLRDTKP